MLWHNVVLHCTQNTTLKWNLPDRRLQKSQFKKKRSLFKNHAENSTGSKDEPQYSRCWLHTMFFQWSECTAHCSGDESGCRVSCDVSAGGFLSLAQRALWWVMGNPFVTSLYILVRWKFASTGYLQRFPTFLEPRHIQGAMTRVWLHLGIFRDMSCLFLFCFYFLLWFAAQIWDTSFVWWNWAQLNPCKNTRQFGMATNKQLIKESLWTVHCEPQLKFTLQLRRKPGELHCF